MDQQQVSLPAVTDALLRKRQLRKRIAGRKSTKSTDDHVYEIFSVHGPADFYLVGSTYKKALELSKQTATEHPGTVVSIWSPYQAHVHQAVADESGKYTILYDTNYRLRAGYFNNPEELVRELVKYINTSPDLAALLEQVENNLVELMTKGVYESQNAVKAFIPVADAAVRKYQDQYGGTQQEQYPQDIRRMTAERLLALFEQEAREEPEKFAKEYLEKAPSEDHTVINLGDENDGKSVVINIYTKAETLDC